jgi:hypothetical protein
LAQPAVPRKGNGGAIRIHAASITRPSSLGVRMFSSTTPLSPSSSSSPFGSFSMRSATFFIAKLWPLA